MKENKKVDLLIVGGGPAGLTAAIYAARAKLNMILLEDKIIGGQVRNSYTIENYPGFKKVSGADLADLMHEQALELGAEIDEFDVIEQVDLRNDKKIIETNSYIYEAGAVIIATGAVPKKLPIKEEVEFAGKGIHYCAVCDGAMYEDKTVAVIGGGNSALEEALFLTRFADKVFMIRRYDYFNGEKATLEEVMENKKIEILFNEDLISANGDNFLRGAKVKNTVTGVEKEIKLDGIFGFIGVDPQTNLFNECLKLTKQGYIITNENMETEIKGVFAAGDVRDKKYRQITTAVSDGTIAALNAEKYINEKKKKL